MPLLRGALRKQLILMRICHNWQRVNCRVTFPSMSRNVKWNIFSTTKLVYQSIPSSIYMWISRFTRCIIWLLTLYKWVSSFAIDFAFCWLFSLSSCCSCLAFWADNSLLECWINQLNKSSNNKHLDLRMQDSYFVYNVACSFLTFYLYYAKFLSITFRN